MNNEIKKWEKGLDYFKKNKPLSNYLNEIDLSFLKQKAYFKTLIGIVIGQQISTSAAKSIKSNFLLIFQNLFHNLPINYHTYCLEGHNTLTAFKEVIYHSDFACFNTVIFCVGRNGSKWEYRGD